MDQKLNGFGLCSKKSQLTIEEHLIYRDLPEDILSRINKLIDWHPFE